MRVPSCHVYAWRFQGLVLSLNTDSVPLASQAMRDGATYAEARATANTEEAARTAAQTAGDGLPEDMPLFTEMMQRLDRVASLLHYLAAAHSLILLGHPESLLNPKNMKVSSCLSDCSRHQQRWMAE